MTRHWARISNAARFMLPSLDPEHQQFDDMRYWRGPIWIVVNYMNASGFEEAGHADWAVRLKSDSRHLIVDHGFHEAFSPVTGAGTGGDDFSWTAAMWLAWCGR
jgi:glycogen debranching enzyme